MRMPKDAGVDKTATHGDRGRVTIGAGARTPYARPGWLLALLYLGYLLSFADRAIFSLALPDLRAAHGFSDAELGILSGLAFAICYAGVAPVAGWLADRYERKWIFAGSVAIWSLATGATAFATSFWEMFAARALVGTGEGGLMLLAVSLLSDTRQGKARDRALGVFISAGAMGNVIALFFGGSLMRHIGSADILSVPAPGSLAPWQTIFVIAAVTGFVFAIVVAATLQEPARTASPTQVGAISESEVSRFLKDHRRLLFTLYVGFSIVQMATVTVGAWIVAVLARQHGLSAGEAGAYFGSTGAVAAVVGALCFGPIISAVRKRGFSDAPILVCTTSAVTFALFLIVGVLASDLHLALALLTCAMLVVYGPTIASYVMMGEMLPAAARARLAGVNTLSNALISNAVGTALVGWLSDHLFVGNQSLAMALCAIVAGAIFVGVAIVQSGRASYRRRMAELAPAAVTGNAAGQGQEPDQEN